MGIMLVLFCLFVFSGDPTNQSNLKLRSIWLRSFNSPLEFNSSKLQRAQVAQQAQQNPGIPCSTTLNTLSGYYCHEL